MAHFGEELVFAWTDSATPTMVKTARVASATWSTR